MLTIIPIKAFKDNYIWLIKNNNTHSCIIVDPGEAPPVIDYLQQQKLTPEAMLITHHHLDHCAGIGELKRQYAIPAFGPDNAIADLDNITSDKDHLSFPLTAIEFDVLAIPGHTLSHLAYYGADSLFCGDTLFSAGCGKLFEGSPSQMVSSLNKLMQFHDQTKIYCGHEYTQANLTFAQLIEPQNMDVKMHLQTCLLAQRDGLPTLPSTISLERLINPFLRTNHETVINSVKEKFDLTEVDPILVFQKLREWKNNF